jgi:G3E family GTPase
VPIHVLTGFLGSGKTTVLNRLLTGGALPASAVIVNELGAIGIDHHLVETSDESLVELSGGCLCCAVRGDLAVTIADLVARRDRGDIAPFERIVVETTGVADPAPVHNLLATDPLLASRTRPGRVVTTVDAANGAATLDRFAEAVRQVALADALVLSKSDLAPVAVPALRARLARINPHAPIRVAVHGVLPDPAALFDEEQPAERAPPPSWLKAGHIHGDGIESIVLFRERPLPGAALVMFVETLAEQVGADLLRVKGLIALCEVPDRPAVLHGAQHVFHPLEFLPAWPDADRRTRLVFVVCGVEREWLECVLDAIVCEVDEAKRILVPAPRVAGPESDTEAAACST